MRYLMFLLTAVMLAGCGGSPAPAHELHAVKLCRDNNWNRVPDEYCPIGDGPAFGHPYAWAYHEYDPIVEPQLIVPYVGYPVERRVYVETYPRRVTTLNLDAGRFPYDPRPGRAEPPPGHSPRAQWTTPDE